MKFRLGCCSKEKNEEKAEENQEQLDERYLDDERYLVDRKVYNHPKFVNEFKPGPFVGFSFIELLKGLYVKHFSPSKHCAKKQLYNRIPAIKWLKSYKLKDNLLADVLAGLTVG